MSANLYKTHSSEKYVVSNKKGNKFFDFVELNGKYQFIWTENLGKSKIFEKHDKEKCLEILDACGINLDEIDFVPVVVTIKIYR